MNDKQKLVIVLAHNANDKVIVTGAGPLIEWVKAGASTICL